ncbi:MAG: hypothetical protein DRP64_12580, partial [Verrucomicrobia bacterium]
VNAAKNTDQVFVVQPATLVDFKSYNLYLPIPFETSLRVDYIYLSDFETPLNFIQMDYRINDTSMNGTRLLQNGSGANLQLYYTGSTGTAPSPIGSLTQQSVQINGNGAQTLNFGSPVIIRKLTFNSSRRGVRFLARFDGEASSAIDVDLGDFFGPFQGVALNGNNCYFPMPAQSSVEFEIQGAVPGDTWNIDIEYETKSTFEPNWRYFHAKSQGSDLTSGHTPYQIMYSRGSGHWVGMSLYETGHDHGGGDFAIIDAESASPTLIHGINGEDYFSFAWFGRGENFPYTEAFDNDAGRLRLHLGNPYPFNESIHLEWATLRNESPRSVSFWYQDSAQDKTITLENLPGLEWDVFGPTRVPVVAETGLPDMSDPDAVFANLPDPARLDAREPIGVYRILHHRQDGEYRAWAKQKSVGPHLNLTYVYRHVMALGKLSYIGYEPRAMMARTRLTSAAAQTVTFQITRDEALELFLNGEKIYSDYDVYNGFSTTNITVNLDAGENVLLAKIYDTTNVNQAHAALSLRILDGGGNDISESLRTPDTSAAQLLARQWLLHETIGSWTLAAWDFERDTTDSSGNGHDATPVGNAQTTTDSERGSILSLDGNGDYLDVPLNVSEKSYAVSLWFKTTSPNGALFEVRNDDGSGHDRDIYLEDGNVVAYLWHEGLSFITSSGTNYADGEWHRLMHIFGTEIGGQKLIIDGELVAMNYTAASSFNAETRVLIGKSNFPIPTFNGLIDQVRISNTAIIDGSGLLTGSDFFIEDFNSGSPTNLETTVTGGVAGEHVSFNGMNAAWENIGDYRQYMRTVGSGYSAVAGR